MLLLQTTVHIIECYPILHFYTKELLERNCRYTFCIIYAHIKLSLCIGNNILIKYSCVVESMVSEPTSTEILFLQLLCNKCVKSNLLSLWMMVAQLKQNLLQSRCWMLNVIKVYWAQCVMHIFSCYLFRVL